MPSTGEITIHWIMLFGFLNTYPLDSDIYPVGPGAWLLTELHLHHYGFQGSHLGEL